MDSHGLNHFGLRFDGPPGTSMPNINFPNAGAINLLSNVEITFSQEGTTDLPKKYLVPGPCTLNDYFYLI